MNERVAKWWSALARSRQIGIFERASNYLKNLSPGDRLIAYLLIGLVVIASIVALLALEQKALVTVPADGGTLVEGDVGSPRFVNPLLAISDSDRDVTALTYAGLMGIGANGSLVPVLAQSYTVSPDGKTYTFTLRNNAKFSDGTAVTADDVVFTVEKAQDPALKSPEYADWAGVTAEALDTHTVQFTLDKPYAPFLENTTLGILPEHLWSSVSDEEFPFSDLAVEPVGAGPFVVGNVTHDSSGLITSYTLKANPLYVLGRPYLHGIRFVFYAQQEDLTAALQNGDVESAYGVPGGADDTKTLTAPYSQVFGVFFNPDQDAIFARAEVRQALSLAIDRQNIVANVLGGYATPIIGPVPPGSGINETPVPSYADPTAEAASVLEEAGWTYDGDAREWKNGSLAFSSVTIKTSNVAELKAVASAVKDDWQKLGISVDIELYEPGDLNQNVIAPRQYDALFFGMVIGRDQDLYAFWDSAERNDPGLNIAMYANKTVDDLLEDARQNPDPAARLSDLQKVEDDIAADYPAAFTHAPDFVYVVPKDLQGVVLPQIATPSDRFAGVADWYITTEEVWPFLVQKHN